MKLSVHQPQYLPWLGLINKIACSDAFVFLDNVQYKKREFQNRNKILAKEGPHWLTVPVITKGKFDQLIKDVEIDNTVDWKKDHFETLRINYSKAPFYAEHEKFLRETYTAEWRRLSELNVHIMRYILDYLEIKTPLYFESALETDGFKTDRIVNICLKLKASVYLSGQGAKNYLEEAKFTKNGLALEYQAFAHPTYSQLQPGFVSHLSVMDLLFNKGKEGVTIMKQQADPPTEDSASDK